MKPENCAIDFHYSFISGMGPWDEGHFIKEHRMRIEAFDINSEEHMEIGKLEFLMIYLEQLAESDFHSYHIFDAHSRYLFDHMTKIFDGDNGMFTDEILNHFNGQIPRYNICFIHEIQILPKFRSRKIGAKAIKDLIFHYAAGCGLFVAQPYPMQFESQERIKENKSLELEQFTDDEEMAGYKLYAYYQRLGFHPIPGIDDLLFYNIAFRNDNLDRIYLDKSESIERKAKKE